MISAYLHSVAEVLAELHERGFYADCSGLVTDHRRLTGPRDVFLAVPGERFDPRRLADDLLRDSRCGLVLVDYDDQRAYQSASVVPVLNLKSMLAELASQYYERPSDAMTVLAVTGTNGKTTVTRWLAQAFGALGKKAAVIGTLGYGEPDQLKAHSGLTTPDVVGVHHILHELLQQGFEVVCIEASSIGLEQRRLAGVSIDLALFTNLTQDHLDYHGTMEAYGSSKLILASWPTLRGAVVNADDQFGLQFAEVVKSRKVPCIEVGRTGSVTCQIKSVRPAVSGQQVELSLRGTSHEVFSSVVGDFNADNLALVFAALDYQQFPVSEITKALAALTPPPGRMQFLKGQPLVVVDYAHTPDALEKTLGALRSVAEAQGGVLWVVFGCGGDRDRGKRPLMGAVAVQFADKVLITSDNPRSESPVSIIREIHEGVPASLRAKVRSEIDRKLAIQMVIQDAGANDVILLAGKGHETTQTIGQEVIPHSDFQCAELALATRGVHA